MIHESVFAAMDAKHDRDNKSCRSYRYKPKARFHDGTKWSDDAALRALEDSDPYARVAVWMYKVEQSSEVSTDQVKELESFMSTGTQ